MFSLGLISTFVWGKENNWFWWKRTHESILSCDHKPVMTDCQCEGRRRGKKDNWQRSCTRTKQNLFIFTEQAENPQSITMTSSISLLFSLSLSLSGAVSVLYLHLSPALCSGSGSGNRSVTCHYWSNSVIRHRALTVCSALYAGTAGVLRAEVEIRFDTHTQRGRGKRADEGRGIRELCGCVWMCVFQWYTFDTFLYLFAWEKLGEGRTQIDWNFLVCFFVFVHTWLVEMLQFKRCV